MKLNPWQYAIARGRDVYGWQVEALEAFGRGYPVALMTCNGAGKTTVVAGCAVDWFFKKHPNGQLVATSSSFNQLQNQTWPAIEGRLPKSFRVQRGSSPLKIHAPAGGEGTGFSTVQPGRAEGWHPKISVDHDPVMLLIDEAKTVPDAIWTAFDRCTIAYALIISSPGPAFGRFFECFHSLKKYYWTRQVPSTECPHIPAWKRERDKDVHGEDSPAYRSMHLAEFTEGGEYMIISPVALRAALNFQPKPCEDGEVVAFFDFARGGDENVFALRRGNKVRIVDHSRDRDTVQTVLRFINKAKELGLQSSQCWGDADGLGGPMCDMFRDKDFPINEFHGGQAALDTVNYENLISEVWIQGVRRIERGDINLGELDKASFDQLTNRKLEWGGKGKKRAEPKKDMREKRQVKSPDRADAILGAIMCGSHMTGSITSTQATGSEIGESDFGVPIVTGW